MTEFAQSTDGDVEVQGHETYDANMALAESLDEMESRDKRYKRRERFWQKGGPALAITPLIAAGIVMASPVGHKMDLNEKIDTDIGAIMSPILLGLAALYGFEENRRKGQELATSALPKSLSLNNSVQP